MVRFTSSFNELHGCIPCMRNSLEIFRTTLADHLLQGGYIDAIDDIVPRKEWEESNHPK